MCAFIKKIEQINFGLMSPDDIREMSVVTVETPDTYEDDGFPIEKGLMDPMMGVIDPSLVCRTCGFRGGDCQGHFGSIELARPVIHIGFGDVIHKILRSTCNSCGRVLLPEDVLEDYTEKINDAMDNKESIAEILKDLQNETKKKLKCLKLR
jgi:DNA-directed RNA polymerase subunit A'